MAIGTKSLIMGVGQALAGFNDYQQQMKMKQEQMAQDYDFYKQKRALEETFKVEEMKQEHINRLEEIKQTAAEKVLPQYVQQTDAMGNVWQIDPRTNKATVIYRPRKGEVPGASNGAGGGRGGGGTAKTAKAEAKRIKDRNAAYKRETNNQFKDFLKNNPIQSWLPPNYDRLPKPRQKKSMADARRRQAEVKGKIAQKVAQTYGITNIPQKREYKGVESE